MPFTITFDDSRDFCLIASQLLGATYIIAPDALKAINQGQCRHTYGKVTAAQEPSQPE
jgi:hypothetical protein